MAERQMTTVLSDVRADHRLRYEFAIHELQNRRCTGHVVDAGAGIGYGSHMLADHVETVTSIEISEEAHQVFLNHWAKGNIDYQCRDLLDPALEISADAVVCFEFIEHVEFYDQAIKRFAKWSDLLIISTPNELVRPHQQPPVNPFHFRHFTPKELKQLLSKHGFSIQSWHYQKSGAEPEILPGTNGKFIIAVATKRPFSFLRSARSALSKLK